MCTTLLDAMLNATANASVISLTRSLTLNYLFTALHVSLGFISHFGW